MKVVVTGAAGFLGSRLADLLLGAEAPLAVTRLVLADVRPPAARDDPRVTQLAVELSAPGAAERLIDADTDVVFHLAAVVSVAAEDDLQLGLRVNLDATRALLDRAARVNPRLALVFASTVGVLAAGPPGGRPLDERAAPTPQNSYGTAKAMCELLINDYSRRGLVRGVSLRLPTVSVRAGSPNQAMTSFASGVVREPLAGLPAACPVPPAQEMWLASPGTVVANIARAAALPPGALGDWRVLHLPGITVTAGRMVEALQAVAGPGAAARVRWQPDERVARLVAGVAPRLDCSRALQLGFQVDASFEDIIRQYIRDDLGGEYVH